MRVPRLIAAVMVLGFVITLGLVSWNAPAASSPLDSVQVSREPGGHKAITVTGSRASDAVLDQPGNGPDLSAMKGRVLTFALALDTHDGDISALDLNGRLFIRDAHGTELPGMARQLSSSAHHTTYAAAFPRLDSRGKALDDPSQPHLTLVIRGVGTLPERSLNWETGDSAGASAGGAARLGAGLSSVLAFLVVFLALMAPYMLFTTGFWAVLWTGAATGGTAPETADLPARRARTVGTVLLFLAGFALMFMVLGAMAGAFGKAAHALKDGLLPVRTGAEVAAGLFTALFGLYLLGVKRFGTGKFERPAAFAAGLALPLGAVSCLGTTAFTSTVTFMGATTWWGGVQVGLLYSLTVALPLLLLTFAFSRWLVGLRSARGKAAVAAGALLLLTGLVMLSGQGKLIDLTATDAVFHLSGGHLGGPVH